MKEEFTYTVKAQTKYGFSHLVKIATAYADELPISINPADLSVTLTYDDATEPIQQSFKSGVWLANLAVDYEYCQKYTETFRFDDYIQLRRAIAEVSSIFMIDFSVDSAERTMTISSPFSCDIESVAKDIEKLNLQTQEA